MFSKKGFVFLQSLYLIQKPSETRATEWKTELSVL